jgi:hypothetical protein
MRGTWFQFKIQPRLARRLTIGVILFSPLVALTNYEVSRPPTVQPRVEKMRGPIPPGKDAVPLKAKDHPKALKTTPSFGRFN